MTNLAILIGTGKPKMIGLGNVNKELSNLLLILLKKSFKIDLELLLISNMYLLLMLSHNIMEMRSLLKDLLVKWISNQKVIHKFGMLNKFH